MSFTRAATQRTTANSLRAGTSQLPTAMARRASTSSHLAPPREHSPDNNTPFGRDPNPSPDPDPDPDRGNDPDHNPDDPDDHGHDHGHPDPDPDADDPTPNLASAITLLAQSVSRPRTNNSKVREPDTFDGSDSKKLRSFLVLCQLNFNDRPTAFRSDQTKVNYALSYLKGTALDWFEPDLLAIQDGGYPPDWYDDYPAFVKELRDNFGPHDPVGDAEADLENLRMRDNQRITKYLVDFNRHASQVKWGPAALRHQLYRGLPSRLKDEIARVGKPDSLAELRTLAQSIDARYWERRTEVSRETSSSTQKTTQNSSNSNQEKKNNSSSSSSKPAASSSSSSHPPKHKNTSTPASDLSSKLGKDGKLTKEERQRRFDNNLCLFCGGTGHTAKECRKASSSAAKARAANAKPEGKSESSDVPKK